MRLQSLKYLLSGPFPKKICKLLIYKKAAEREVGRETGQIKAVFLFSSIL